MFNSLKKSLFHLSGSSNTIASFSYFGSFEVINNQISIKNSIANRATLIHKVFRLGEELEIHFHETNKKVGYYIVNVPYFNSTNDTVFEVRDKDHNGKLIMVLESQKRSLQVMASNNFGEGHIFSTINLSPPTGGKAGLINALDVHFKNWVKENDFLLELGTEIDDFVALWQIAVENQIPNFIHQFGFDNDHIRRTIKHYRLNFLAEASKKIK